MPPEIIHSVILIVTIALSFLISKTHLAQYDLQISAGLFIFLFLVRKISPYLKNNLDRLLESVIFTLIVLSIVNSSGGTVSPFFFLLYFLLFSLALLLEPVIAIVTTLALVVFFLMSLPVNQSFNNLLPIFSLAFLTPFALFLGQEYKKVQKLKVKSQNLEKSLSDNTEQTYLFLSLMLKNHLKTIKTTVDNFIGDHQLHEIKHHAKQMEKLIEQFEKHTD